jgi:hypothetical protein
MILVEPKYIREAMMRSMKTALIVVASMTTCLPAIAQQKTDLPKEGKYDTMSCWSGTQTLIELSKDASVQTSDVVGTNRANPPGSFLDMTTFRCIGAGSTFNGKYSARDVCEAVDKDGDKIITRFITEGGKTTVDMAVGTGKYEGITRKGGIEDVGTFPSVKPGTVQGCDRGTGTYTLKAEASGTTTPPAATPSK